MIASSIVEGIKRKYDLLKPELDERGRRLWAVSEARGLGHGGIAAVARATGWSELTIRRGRKEVVAGGQQGGLESLRIRRRGGGRKELSHEDPELLVALGALGELTARGGPRAPLRLPAKSTL